MSFPCPVCGFEVFEEPPGSYELCPICGWEDDEVQLRFPSLQGGANKECLYEWQQRLLSRLPLETREHMGFRRVPDWRPLKAGEGAPSTAIPRTGRDYFDAIGTEEPRYYWRDK